MGGGVHGIDRGALARAIAVTVGLLSAAGCSQPEPVRPSPAAAVSSAPAPSPSPSPEADVAVTLDEAQQALDTFLATDSVVRAAGADRWTLALTRDGRRSISAAQIHSRPSGAERPRYTWSRPTAFVPRQSRGSSPQWFAAAARRGDAAGNTRTVMLVFVRAGEGSPWQISAQSVLYEDEEPPEIALDEEGYAIALDPRDQSVAVSPNLVGPLHATVAEEGPQGFASGLIAPGPHTTGFAEDIEATRKQAQSRDCMSYTSIFALQTSYPIYALRTADRGALVFYTLVRTSTWSTDPGLKCGKGRPVAIPRGARWLLGAGDVQIYQKRRIQETQQYVTVVPRKASTAPARVIGYEGAVTDASNT